MRYNRAERLIQLALEMQAVPVGLSIADIENKFGVSRRTAVRMRDAVIRAFPQAAQVPSNDRYKRWRISRVAAKDSVGVTADDMDALEGAAAALDQLNLHIHSSRLRALGTKVRLMQTDQRSHLIAPIFGARQVPGNSVHRLGFRSNTEVRAIELLSEAAKARNKVSFDYNSATQGRQGRRTVCPLGLIYSHPRHLIARDEEDKVTSFSLPAISRVQIMGDYFSSESGYGVPVSMSGWTDDLEDEPVSLVWKFRPGTTRAARTHLFHECGRVDECDDGSLEVRFTARGPAAMAWYLLNWGRSLEAVTAISPG